MHKIRCCDETLEDGVHETSVVLSVCEADEREALLTVTAFVEVHRATLYHRIVILQRQMIALA